MALRLAMWSGPRNISTAMMRSWGQRADTAVIDEPLYAHYLLCTGRKHPGAAEVMAHHETDAALVVSALIGPVPGGKAIYFQKHMAHHLLPGVDRAWLDHVTNCFLIRDPAEMLASLAEKTPDAELEDTGLPRQLEIFHRVRARTGRVPPVIDTRDVLLDPRQVLGRLCEAVGAAFDEAMLSWPRGRRDTDGVWAKHWYQNVERSTGFEPHRLKAIELPRRFDVLHRQCRALYDELAAHRLTP